MPGAFQKKRNYLGLMSFRLRDLCFSPSWYDWEHTENISKRRIHISVKNTFSGYEERYVLE